MPTSKSTVHSLWFYFNAQQGLKFPLRKQILSVLNIGPRIRIEHQMTQEPWAGGCLYSWYSQILDHREMHLAAIQRQQSEQLPLCWRLSVLGWETACMFRHQSYFCLRLFNSKPLFVLVILVIFLKKWAYLSFCITSKEHFLEIWSWGANFMSIFNLTELSGSDWPRCPSQNSVLQGKEVERDIFFFLQKLSFPSGNIRGKKTHHNWNQNNFQ